MIDDECYDTLSNPEDYAEYIYPGGVYTLQTQITDIPTVESYMNNSKLISDRTAHIRVVGNNGPVANNDSQGIYVGNPETFYPLSLEFFK